MKPGIALAGLLFALSGLSCVSERTTPTGPQAGDCTLTLEPEAIGRLGTVVAIRSFAFEPREVRVPVGSRVTWVNCETEQVAHTSTAAGEVWNSPLLSPGQSFTTTFDRAGTFDYICAPHPFMRGRVVVE